MAMATTTGNFMPDLWSENIIKTYRNNLSSAPLAGYDKPKRSRGAQLLRDAALGHPEYPSDPRMSPDEFRQQNMTATEVRMRNEMYSHQLDAARFMSNPAIFSPSNKAYK